MCGRRIGETNHKYLIKPKAKVFSYWIEDYHNSVFSKELDICEKCWYDMVHYITVRKNDNDKIRTSKEEFEIEGMKTFHKVFGRAGEMQDRMRDFLDELYDDVNKWC